MLVQQLEAAGLAEVEVLVEYQLPWSSRRVDALLLGEHPNGGLSVVVIELKQWSGACQVDPESRMVTVDGWGPGVEHLDPREQVRGYVDYLRFFHAFLHAHPDAVRGLVYLHNATSRSIDDLYEHEFADLAEIWTFAGDQSAAFQRFLRSRLTPVPRADIVDGFLNSDIRPSAQLLRLVHEEIEHCGQFTLLAEQQLAFEKVQRAVRKARSGSRKRVVIVKGGPGSGKSVIAISLLAELSKHDVSVVHVTGSRAFTMTLREIVGQRRRGVRDVFLYFRNFKQADPNSVTVLIADEAHRIREYSDDRFSPRSSRQQIDELVQVANVPVFLLDQNQRVRRNEVGTVELIRGAAQRNDASTDEVELKDQFRSAGSLAYIDWVERLLGLQPGGPAIWEQRDQFELLRADSPQQLEDRLNRYQHEARERGEECTARITAGFCWPWSEPTNGVLVDDVRIGDWHRPWNLKQERRLNRYPPSWLWATDPEGFGQVGCIYTAQGFEYDYNGVIFGPDLVWRAGRWVPDPTKSADPAHKGRAARKAFDRLVRNTYKVLLTRGLRGCIVYSVDDETQALFRELGLPRA